MAIVVICFDGVKDKEFEQMANNPDNYPNIAKMKAQSLYKNGVRTVFVSNTYPIHAAVSTGRLPREHGIISNFTDSGGECRWAQMAEDIRSETIWDAAAKKGLSVAAILWPTTCGAKIKWNMPETHIHGKENQVVESLRHGSALFQIKALLRHITKLRFANLLSLDSFTTAVTCDLLRKKRSDLTLVHLLAYDLTCHRAGSQSKELDAARKSLDMSLGKIMEAAGRDIAVLVFSDHGHLDVFETVDLTLIYKSDVYEQCGGCAFFGRKIENIERHSWFGRFLTEREMDDSGYASRVAFGIAAKPGYCFAEKTYKANHGYPADYEDYNVFYALRSKTAQASEVNAKTEFGDVRDITAIIARVLGLDMQ